ncbi:DRMBL-domain-containing protein [Hortaea werneckii]|nr:DRMBL-domain-containing protein [Hortaea werneckii]
MFRKPRQAAEDASDGTATPSVGRPPTPPGTPAKTPFTLAVPPSVPAPKMATTKTRSNKASSLPTLGRQGPTGSAKKTGAVAKAKPQGKGNSSILSFFKKADSTAEEDLGLFVEDKKARDRGTPEPAEQQVTSPGGEEQDGAEGDRFNESSSSVKKRRIEAKEEDGEDEASLFGESPVKSSQPVAEPRSGPFMEESNSEQEEEQPEAVIPIAKEPETLVVDHGDLAKEHKRDEPVQPVTEAVAVEAASPPALVKQETSFNGDLEDFEDFEGIEGDFDEDAFEGGDEFMERRYMEEQARLESLENDGKASDTLQSGREDLPKPDENGNSTADAGPSCPICSASLAGVNEQEAGVHVNNCLDGNPTPLPQAKKTESPAPSVKPENTPPHALFKRPQRTPKPAQASPFSLGQPAAKSGSAFNKLMSGHAEDAAWAEAAASEHASRGKPSYQRTCPFYKILPGLFICVDAFRYGAVQGCQAYFLSHFHSDHYVGLTSNWSHGPIFCSKVTGNLVRQHLRVDPKYVVDLEFEQTVEVPGTKGVKVTMMSANHCPGSSLYLFEKVVGKKNNGEPRLQRILHCGDFRACRQHVEHPLLMPEVRDKVTGKSKEQKIDVCYLDTTYLNPKYAFPSQESVIGACADMCVSLSKHSVDEDDGWEKMKRNRAGEGMAKFIRKDSNSDVKEEPAEEEEGDMMKVEKNPHASQQILRTNSLPDVKTGRGRLLVVVGTYSIGKERICIGIAKALNSKIYAPPSKQRIVAALEDPELNERMTNDPKAAQVHMTPLFEIRADTLDDYLKDYFPHFTRAVGFRPSGWNYKPPTSRFLESPSVQTVLNGDNWRSNYGMKDLVPQRGSTSRASCFGVPYSEHSSFRELTMFCCALRIEKIIPTVNVGSAKSRGRMKDWCERWALERRKNGVWKLPEDGSW